MADFHLELLGHFHLMIQGATVSIPQPRLQSLLAYFHLHRHSNQLRQHLAYTFWPDSTEAQARGNLRKAIYDLRQLIPNLDHYLVAEGSDQPDQNKDQNKRNIYLDVIAFEEQLEQVKTAQKGAPLALQAALEEAIHLYRGDLLPGCYDEWLLVERERLREHFLHLLEQLVYLLEERREYAAAIPYTQRLLQADSLRESTYRALMRLHLQNGDRARALRVYHTCATLLQQELGVEPSAETQTLYHRLLQMESMTELVPVRKGKLSLVGRQQEWSALLEGWHASFAGQAHFMLIAGEAGIGKSRLADELRLWAEQQGYATASTRSYAAEGQLAYAPVTEWLRSPAIRNQLGSLEAIWLSEVARLLPELLTAHSGLVPPQPLVDSWQRQRFREALARAFLAGKLPLLLMIDDLQWCDLETLEWLHYLLRMASSAQLLIVGTVRSEEIGPDHPLLALLMNLRQEEKIGELELGPLNATETGQLAVQVAGHELDAEQIASLYAETEGYPLFIVEITRARQADRAAGARANGEPIPRPAGYLPPKVQAIIGSRLRQLTPQTHELVAWAAVVGRAFSAPVLASAGGFTDEALARGLDELWQRRIIREYDENSYDFSHDRIREAAYAEISPPRRRMLHRHVAHAIEDVHSSELDAVSGQIANHYELACQPEDAVIYYQRAAEGAQRVYAHAEAILYLDKELGLIRQLPPTTEHLRQELRLQLVLGISLTTVRGMTALESKQVYERALALAMEVGDDRERFVAVAGLHIAESTRGQIKVAYELAKQGVALAERIGDLSGLVEARGRLATALWHLGQWQASREFLEQALAYERYEWSSSSLLLSPHHMGVVAQRFLAFVLWILGYPDQAQEEMARALRLAEEVAHLYTLGAAVNWAAWYHLFRREPAPAKAMAEQAVILYQRFGGRFLLSRTVHVEGWVLVQQGQLEAGIAHMNEGIAAVRRAGAPLDHPFLLSLAEIYGEADQPEAGLRLLDEALNQIDKTGECYLLAELHRVKGELLHTQGADACEAEACLLHSLDVARRQEAKSLELRTALSLARLWQQQGKCRQAHDLLAPIYEWFTEGFDTPDLIEAKMLLAALS